MRFNDTFDFYINHQSLTSVARIVPLDLNPQSFGSYFDGYKITGPHMRVALTECDAYAFAYSIRV